MLEKEIEMFYQQKAVLQEGNPSGGFVVINGKEILGVWHDRQDALREGINKYGNVPFLVKDINEVPHVINFTRQYDFS